MSAHHCKDLAKASAREARTTEVQSPDYHESDNPCVHMGIKRVEGLPSHKHLF